MRRKIKGVLLLLAICLCSCMTIFAADGDGFPGKNDCLIDDAGVLNETKEASLREKLNEISVRQNMEVAAIVVDTLGGQSAQAVADDSFDYMNYGYGDARDGVLLLISVGDGEYHISTHGYGITVFTDDGIDYICNKLEACLKNKDFAGAIEEYAELSDDFITQARTGKPYTDRNLPRKPLGTMWIFISVGAGVLIGCIVVACMVGQLKSVEKQELANYYVRSDSMKITEQKDMFLYHTLTRKPRPKETDGGSSSTHTSSSGSTHGGGGGKF